MLHPRVDRLRGAASVKLYHRRRTCVQQVDRVERFMLGTGPAGNHCAGGTFRGPSGLSFGTRGQTNGLGQIIIRKCAIAPVWSPVTSDGGRPNSAANSSSLA